MTYKASKWSDLDPTDVLSVTTLLEKHESAAVLAKKQHKALAATAT